MKIKFSEYTPFLVIALIVVLIVQHFYDPLQLYDFWEVYSSENKDSGVPIIVMQAVFSIMCPIMMSMIEFMAYMGNFMISANGAKYSVLFISAVMCLGFVLVSYFLEKFHLYWHEEEGMFAMCVDMLCIENIVMYFFNLIFYFLTERVIKSNLSNEIWGVLFIIIVVPVLWAVLFYLLYILVGMLITLGIPAGIIVLLDDTIAAEMQEIILIVLFVFFSQVVWRLCSGIIYSKLLDMFSFHHMSLD